MKNLISLGVFLLILLSVQVNAQEQSVLKIRVSGFSGLASFLLSV